MAAIGFIGIGNMGRQMAKNLITKGYPLTAYDIKEERLDEIEQAGANRAKTIKDAVSLSDVAILSLPDHLSSEKVMLGPEGVLVSARPNTIVIDTTTSLPSFSKRIYLKAKEASVGYLDAGVSGGPDRSLAGTLTLMVGGDKSTFEAAKPVLKDMGREIHYMGSTGSGVAMKLVNNLMAICNTGALVEAIVLGVKSGIDVDKLCEVINTSSGNSYEFQLKYPRIVKRNFARRFSLSLEYKDIDLATSFGEELGVPLFVSNATKALFGMGKALGLGEEDNIAVIKVLEHFTGVTVGRSQ
jgi:3-hydroxyisobutyrate dehydrogenase-like beta-hydroxyacid dehydrogenase